jgi:ferredoxin
MATMITAECINCGACEPECPNTAIYQGGVEWEQNGVKHPALVQDVFYIVPQKCTECVGFYDQEACAAVCPVDVCIPNPEIPETEDILLARAKELHPDVQFAPDFPSRFHPGRGDGAAAPAAAPAAAAGTPAPAPAPNATPAPAAARPRPRPRTGSAAAHAPKRCRVRRGRRKFSRRAVDAVRPRRRGEDRPGRGDGACPRSRSP